MGQEPNSQRSWASSLVAAQLNLVLKQSLQVLWGVRLLSQAPLAAFSGEPAPGGSSYESGKKMKCVCVFVLKRHRGRPHKYLTLLISADLCCLQNF